MYLFQGVICIINSHKKYTHHFCWKSLLSFLLESLLNFFQGTTFTYQYQLLPYSTLRKYFKVYYVVDKTFKNKKRFCENSWRDFRLCFTVKCKWSHASKFLSSIKKQLVLETLNLSLRSIIISKGNNESVICMQMLE